MKKLHFLLILVPTLANCYTVDSDCFDSAFGGYNSNQKLGNEVLVTIKHIHQKQSNFGDVQTSIKSTKKITLVKGLAQVITYRNPSSMFWTDYNPRNLTLLFDGEEVKGAIGHLKDRNYQGAYTQQWLPCQAQSSSSRLYLDFHQSSDVFLSGNTASSWEKLEIEVSQGPLGPSYDSECKVQIPSNGSFKVQVKHISRTSISTGSFESVREERNATLTPGQVTLLEFNHTVATGDYGFVGNKVSPRNLTLWVEGDVLNIGIAYLMQSHAFISGHQENSEKWECPELDGEKVVFCSFNTRSSSSFSSRKDVFQVSMINEGVKQIASKASPMLMMAAWKQFL